MAWHLKLVSKKGLVFLLIVALLVVATFWFFYQKKPASFKLSQSQEVQKKQGRVIAAYTLENFEITARAKQMIEEGRQKHEEGDYDLANRVLSKLLTKYPYAGYREEASCLLAQGLFYKEDLVQSKQVISRLKEHNPDVESPWLACALLVEGQIYEKGGQKSKAIQLYRQVIASLPDNSPFAEQAEELLLQISF